tara:strand:+ start:794 stop:1297 length:504 start_codon:yes stop_codon:yes gene_type:complete
MTFEEYEHEHLFALTECAKKLVRMGWNARGEHGSSPEKPDNSGSSQGILDSSACEVSITPEMIEAGAQRLVVWEDGSEWPDSWGPMVVAAARNDAERVLRSALNARADHIADDRKMVKGNVALAGDITDEDETTFHRAVIIQFATAEDLNAAIRSGQCRFTVFGGEV